MAKKEITCSNCGARYMLQKHTRAMTVQCKKCGTAIEVPPPQAPAQPEAQPPAQPQFAGYQNLHVLSENDRHIVYRAEQTAMKRTVALKVLKDQGEATDFLQNARLTANMRHGNIVSIYDVSAEGAPYFTMEYVEGSTVREMLDSAGLPPVADAARIAASAGSAFSHAMRKGAQTIQVDAETIMLTSAGEVKLLPSTFSQAAGSDDSPENQAIRSLGVLLYTLLTGKEPRLAAKRLMPPSTCNKDVTPTLDTVTMQLLRGGRKGYASIVTATQAVKHLAGSKEASSRRSSEFRRHIEKRKSSNKTAAIISTIAVVLVVGGIVGGMIYFVNRQTKITNRLDRYNISVATNDYASIVAEGEAFLEKYPSHKAADKIRQQVAAAKATIERYKRQNELTKAIDEVMEAARQDPSAVQTYLDQLDEIQEEYSSLEGIERDYILPQKKIVKNLWEDKKEAEQKRILSLIKGNEVGKAYERLQQLKEMCGRPEMPDDCKELVQNIEKKVDSMLNEWFIRIRNAAFALQQQGKDAEAEALFQNVADNWRFEYYVDQAKLAIQKIREEPDEQPTMTSDSNRSEQWRETVDNAMGLSQEGKFDEAIKLYQNIVDNWDTEEYKKLAQENIEDLKARKAAKEEEEVQDGN